MHPRIKLLEIILSPNYTGLTTVDLSDLIYELPVVPKHKRMFVINTVSKLIQRGFLKRDGFIVLPNAATNDYYKFLINHRFKNKDV